MDPLFRVLPLPSAQGPCPSVRSFPRGQEGPKAPIHEALGAILGVRVSGFGSHSDGGFEWLLRVGWLVGGWVGGWVGFLLAT